MLFGLLANKCRHVEIITALIHHRSRRIIVGTRHIARLQDHGYAWMSFGELVEGHISNAMLAEGCGLFESGN